ncbi:hypothetical protein [Pseudonocardia adelaidensis]|uniref:Ig-like domain-containing protein n=1 Tax=Pseudonocardia adelaidensis TaxID=648754 RepID=A0ABP9P498_9PSEU
MVGLAGLLVALVVPILPASPPDRPELELSTHEAAPGDDVGVVGRGYAGCVPQEPTDTAEPQPENIVIDPPPAEPPPVVLRWESEQDPQPLGEATLDTAGSFTATVTVPAGAGAEPFYLVSASCRRGPAFDEISESAVIVVVAPPPPTTTTPPPTSDPPPTSAPPPSSEAPPPSEAPPTGTAAAAAPTAGPVGSAAPEVTSTGSDALLAALVAALATGLGLLLLIRAVRRRSRPHNRPPSVSAVAAQAPPGVLAIRPRGQQHTVALRVVVRAEPGVPSVHRPKE